MSFLYLLHCTLFFAVAIMQISPTVRSINVFLPMQLLHNGHVFPFTFDMVAHEADV